MGQNSIVDQKQERVENFILFYFLNSKEREEKMNTVLDLQMKFRPPTHPGGEGLVKEDMIYCIKLIDNYFGRYAMHLTQQ